MVWKGCLGVKSIFSLSKARFGGLSHFSHMLSKQPISTFSQFYDPLWIIGGIFTIFAVLFKKGPKNQ